MSMIAKENEKTSIPRLEDGVYTAISSMLIDLGVQRNEMFDKEQRKFIFIWNIVGEKIKIGEEEFPRIMTKEYSFSLDKKSNLRKDLEAWRGQSFTEEELKGFLLVNILNKGCQLQIINKENNGKFYNNIVGIMALAKGMIVEKLDKITIFDIEDKTTWENYDVIPQWIKDKIKKALNLEQTEFNKYIEEYEASKETLGDIPSSNTINDTDDDLPF